MTFRTTASALLLTLMSLLPAGARAALTEADLLPVDQAYRLSAKAVGSDRVEFSWTIAPGYYLYRHRTRVAVVGGGFAAGALQMPAGDKHQDEFFGAVETYRGRLVASLPGTAGAASAQFKVTFQGCADIGVCYPPTTRVVTVAFTGAASAPTAETSSARIDPLASLTGTPPAAAAGAARAPAAGGTDALPEDQAFRIEAIAESSSALLVRLTPAPGYYLYRDKTSFDLPGADGVSLGAPRFPAGKSHRDEHFGEVVVYFEPAEITVPLLRNNTGVQTVMLRARYQGCLTDGICYPPMTKTLSVALPAGDGATSAAATSPGTATGEASPAGAATSVSFVAALLLALLGGIILNLMPCVLPVLSLKALGVVQAGESAGAARAHALWYSAGVMVSFAAIGGAVLALRSAGEASGWGFQLQVPGVTATLALLMFAIGLSLSGLWQFGASFAGAGQSLAQKSGPAGDFFTGVLAVVVASPCTAPFMGGALGYAFSAPPAAAFGVFLALGLGLSLPFLLIGFVPALAALLPRPGAWMDTLKQWLAYPMYLTAVWLAWVFGQQRGVDGLGALLAAATVLALGLWWFERQRFSETAWKKWLAWALIALAVGVGIYSTRPPSKVESIPYSTATLTELRAKGRPVFIDMTADWCITCKVNEKAVLHTDKFEALLGETNAVYLVGDWTNQDQEISALLDEYKSPGVPLYVVYPANGGPGVKLPQLLTDQIVRDAMTEAAKR
jgi:thiol:disulfide interchange protein